MPPRLLGAVTVDGGTGGAATLDTLTDVNPAGKAEHCDSIGMFYQGKLIALGTPHQLKTERVKGELLELAVSDYARALALLTPLYRQVNLFGNTVHLTVDSAASESPRIRGLLEREGVAVQAIDPIPFGMEDVFVSLVEEQQKEGA